MLTVFATCFSMSQRTVEVTKYFLCACAVSMMLSVRIFDKLTFDCRWWNNDNSETCKTAFNTFAAGAFFTCLTHICLLAVTVFHAEKERSAEWSDISEGGGSSDAPREVSMDMGAMA